MAAWHWSTLFSFLTTSVTRGTIKTQPIDLTIPCVWDRAMIRQDGAEAPSGCWRFVEPFLSTRIALLLHTRVCAAVAAVSHIFGAQNKTERRSGWKWAFQATDTIIVYPRVLRVKGVNEYLVKKNIPRFSGFFSKTCSEKVIGWKNLHWNKKLQFTEIKS